jgi:very-short-patch-repair endonuclease
LSNNEEHNSLEIELENEYSSEDKPKEWSSEGFFEQSILSEKEKEEEIDWSNHRYRGWEPIKYYSIQCEDMTLAQKWLQELAKRHKTGIRLSMSKTGTERHQIAIDRIVFLINYYKLLSHHKFSWAIDIPLDRVLYSKSEKLRFKKLDNIKKYMYRFDIYIHHFRNLKDDGFVHTDRRIVEIDGGYHKKWRQMAKDGWRDKDTLSIMPDAKIIRFDVGELVPESMDLNKDFTSPDYDVARKILTAKDFYSTATKTDLIGRATSKNS